MTDDAIPPIDRQVLAALESDTSRDLMPELVAVFLKSANGRMTSIAAHAAAGNLEGIAAESHALKSSAATFGAVQVRRISAELEAAGKGGDRRTADRLSGELAQALAAAQSALDAYVREISG